MSNNSFTTSVVTLIELLLGVAGIYFGISTSFPHPLINISCLIAGVFVLLQALDTSDKKDHRGRYNDRRDNQPPRMR